MDTGLPKEVSDKLISLLAALFPQSKIYLFGSRATGHFQRTSDIDIAIDAGHKLPGKDIDEAKAIMGSLNIVYSVDIVDLYNIPNDLKESILRNKIIWKN